MLLMAGLILQLQRARLTVKLQTKLREGEAHGPAHWQQDAQGLKKFAATPEIIIAIFCAKTPLTENNVVRMLD